jgi:hypothetical protein
MKAKRIRARHIAAARCGWRLGRTGGLSPKDAFHASRQGREICTGYSRPSSSSTITMISTSPNPPAGP